MPPIVSRSKILLKFFYLFSALGTMRLFSMVINASIFTKFDYIWDSHKPQQKNCIQILTEDCQIKLLSCRVWTWNLIHFFFYFICACLREWKMCWVCVMWKRRLYGDFITFWIRLQNFMWNVQRECLRSTQKNEGRKVDWIQFQWKNKHFKINKHSFSSPPLNTHIAMNALLLCHSSPLAWIAVNIWFIQYAA